MQGNLQSKNKEASDEEKDAMERLKEVKKARIGLYTAGLHAYWAQFEGLRERIAGYGKFIEREISGGGAEVFNFGLVDNEMSAREAGEYFNKNNVDIVFCHAGTYFCSAAVISIHQICKARAVILNLQPTEQMNYEKTGTGEWLAHCVGCPVPELCNAFDRAGIRFEVINGLLGLRETPEISMADEVTAGHPSAKKAWEKIRQWVNAAKVKHTMQYSRFGFLGGNYCGMLDMYNDFTLIQGRTDIHVEILEMCDLDHCLKEVTPGEVKKTREMMEEFFTISGDSPSDPIAKKPTEEQMEWSATVAAAQFKMAKEYDLDALAYYYHGRDANAYEQLQSGFIVGNSLLTAMGVPCAGEGDLKTAIAMKICDTLDKGGSFCEIVAGDYKYDTMILGHDGPFHISISDGKPVLRGMGVYHGKRGSGVSVEAHVVTGPVTTLGVTQTKEDGLKFIVSEGTAENHPILTIGNTQTHVKFKNDIDTYMDAWFREAPTHHFAMSVGHNAELFKKTAALMDIKCVEV